MHNSTGIISPQAFNFPPVILDDFLRFLLTGGREWLPFRVISQPDSFLLLTQGKLTLYYKIRSGEEFIKNSKEDKWL